jgi:hypothetical protein
MAGFQLSLDDIISNSVSSSDYSTPIDVGNSGWSLSDAFSGIQAIGSGAIDLTKSLAGAYMGIQQQALTVQSQQAAIDIAKVNAANNQKINLMQADYQLRNAQLMTNSGANLYSSSGISQAIGNMQTMAAQALNGNGGSTMLLLTIAGVVLAYLQYAKRK